MDCESCIQPHCEVTVKFVSTLAERAFNLFSTNPKRLAMSAR